METDTDETLLARLNALHKSHISLHPNPNPNPPGSASASASIEESSEKGNSPVTRNEDTHEQDLKSRFRRLMGSGSGVRGTRIGDRARVTGLERVSTYDYDGEEDEDEDDGKTVEQLLAELGPEPEPEEQEQGQEQGQEQKQWKPSPSDPDNIPSLLNQARKVLPNPNAGNAAGEKYVYALSKEISAERNAIGLSGVNDGISSVDGSPRAHDEVEPSQSQPQPSEDDLAAQSLQDILDSLALEPPSPSLSPPPRPTNPTPITASQGHSTSASAEPLSTGSVSFPSIPTTLPSLPSPPTAAPSKAQPKTKFSDREIESWCIICLADGNVKCLGCDGDLYCTGCWKEGHVGKEAGLEERGHRWVKFRG